ncbi:MAG: 50S ribosomal protein L15 [Minisyncoccales bacterium]
MQIHELNPKHKKDKKKRVGRGGTRGTYCGRGVKGQLARAGSGSEPAIRRFIKRYPKLRGYKFKPVLDKPAVINVEVLNANFNKGDKVTPKILVEKGLISRNSGKIPKVKILGRGKIDKKIIVENCKLSKSAKKKIEKADGEIH